MIRPLRRYLIACTNHIRITKYLHTPTSIMNCPASQPHATNNGLSKPTTIDHPPITSDTSALPITPVACTAADAVQLATDQLRAQRVIALPTDTIYGFACCANSESAIRRLYAIKGREETKAVAICVPDIVDVRHWGCAEHLADELLQRLLPGPVTIVLNKRAEHLRNPYLNPGFAKIGMRIPDSEFIRRVCIAYGLPLALTSANRSAAQSTLAVHEFEPLWPSLAAVFDGGPVGLTQEQRAGSTIVDLSRSGECTVVRSGVAAAETLRVIRSFGIRVVA